MWIRKWRLPSFSEFCLLWLMVLPLDNWHRRCTTSKLWILWRIWWRMVTATVRRQTKVGKVRRQVCCTLWFKWRFDISGDVGIPVQWFYSWAVSYQFRAFFWCCLCITLARHHTQPTLKVSPTCLSDVTVLQFQSLKQNASCPSKKL